MLALAHKIQDAINRGVVRDHGDAAKRLGLTWTRVTRLLDLTLLEPEIQEELLFAESVDGAETMSERTLRVVVQAERWAMQREVWRQF
ncbi:MAG: hypothetical protein JXA30_07195 [Deltaproteobacteria bacterium]|nr:hypothetical protein [Deltaproteobacteria bacterium]